MMNKRYWENLLTGAAILGGAFVVQMVLGYLLRNVESMTSGLALNLFGFAAIVWVLVFFGHRAARIAMGEGVDTTAESGANLNPTLESGTGFGSTLRGGGGGREVFSYGAAFGFSLLVLVFSGAIVGVCQWVLQNMVDPTYYAMVYQNSLKAMIAVGKMDAQQIEIMKRSSELMRSIWGMIGASAFSMLLQGGLVALLTAAYVKRGPKL